MRINNVTLLAHREAYKLAHGRIPRGKLVLHKCDTRRCINPEHLYAGTAAQNTDDMLRRGRGRNHLGYAYGRRKEAGK